MDSEFLIRSAFYVTAALAVIFLVQGIYLGVIAPLQSRRSVNRRLKARDEGLSGEQALLRIKAERGIFDRDVKVMGGLRKLIVQSGLRTTLTRFVFILIFSSLGLTAVFMLLTSLPDIACLALGGVFGALVPIQFVRIVRSRRQREFTSQLPDALDVVVRSLRSGHPVQTAMALVGREMADPVGSEFGITVDEITYGLDMPRALQNLAARVGVPDLSLLVTAVSLQSTSGGNLSEVLDNLSKVLRERFQLRRKVRAISAEGRYSAYGLTLLPWLIAGAIYAQNPRYYSDVWHEPFFQVVMVGLVLWSLVGDFMMYKMINFKF
ncbi:type II secretion system F family protein [Aestuariivirga sp.]|uniref:type II secretion system F family protein n=1 Tax=Aestuariivirga sp. TaxID=2650926 RepID=UPI003919DD83